MKYTVYSTQLDSDVNMKKEGGMKIEVTYYKHQGEIDSDNGRAKTSFDIVVGQTKM